MSSLNSKNFSTNLPSSTGDNLPPIENEMKPFLQNQKMGMTGEYQEVLEPLQEALVNYYDTVPEKNRELAGKILAKLALPITKTGEGSSPKAIGYIPIMNMVPTKTDKRKVLKKDDRVYHPSHYTWLKELCGVEVIDITRHMDFDLGNAIKYILRQGHKTEKGISDNVRYASMQMYEWTKEEVLSEIERLREKDYPTDTFEEAAGYYSALDDIERFLKEENGETCST